MQVWIVNPFEEFPVNGTRSLRYGTLCRILAERGHDTVWWSSDFSHLTKKRRLLPPENDGFSYRLIQTPPYCCHVGLARWRNHHAFSRGFYRAARVAVRAGEIGRPDLIVVSLPPLGIAREAFRLREFWGCRVVVDIVDAWPETFLRLVPGSEAVGRFLLKPLFSEAASAYRGADGIVVVARTFLDLPRNAGSKAPVHLTYLGGDSDAGCTIHNSRSKNQEPTKLRFVYIGAMARSYDLETVVRAAAKVKKVGARFELHLAGAGPKEEALRAFVGEHGLSETIIFHGYLGAEKLKELLADADVAINPIFDDSWITFPYKMSEYLGAGLAVINSLSGEVTELLAAHDCGMWYPAGDVDRLAEALLEYCENPEVARRQGENALALAEREFDRSKTYPRLAAFLEEVAISGRPKSKSGR